MPMASCDTNTNDIMWNQLLLYHLTKRSHIAPYFDCLDVRSEWFLWQCWWHHLMPTSVPMAWQNKKSQVAPHFNPLESTSAMVPLIMPSASHAAYVNASGSIWPKWHATPHFNHFDIRNGMMPLKMPSASCDIDTSASGITWPSCTSFQLSCPKE